MKLKIKQKTNFNNKKKTYELLDIDKRISRVFNYSGAQMTKEAKREMLVSKKGVKYPNLPNRSSTKGEGLASQSGKTKDSIHSKLSEARYLDFGGNTEQLAIWEGDSFAKYHNRPTLLKTVKKFASIIKGRLTRK